MKSFTHYDNPMIENRPDPPEPEKIESWEDLPAFKGWGREIKNNIYFILTVLLGYYNRSRMLRADLLGLVEEFAFAYFGDDNALDSALVELESYRQERGL